jgi:hypothetical protein
MPYKVGDLVRMFDQVDKVEYFGIIQTIEEHPKEKNQKVYEVLWLDEETEDYQPFSWHLEKDITLFKSEI